MSTLASITIYVVNPKEPREKNLQTLQKKKKKTIIRDFSKVAEYKVTYKIQFYFYKLAKDNRENNSTKNIKALIKILKNVFKIYKMKTTKYR